MRKSFYRSSQVFLVLGTFLSSLGFLSQTHAQESLSYETIRAENNEFPQWGYYTVRRDFRKCISPICGGFFIQQKNLKATPCADGVFRNECYVSSIDWNSLNLGTEQLTKLQSQDTKVIVRGNLFSKKFDGFGELGVLQAKEVFIAATNAPAKGKFVGLKDNGIVCVTEPCFFTNRLVLNKPNSSKISSIDVSQVGATLEQIEAARKAVNNEGLIAIGITKTTKDGDGINGGVNFFVTQFYLRLGIKQ